MLKHNKNRVGSRIRSIECVVIDYERRREKLDTLCSGGS